MGKRSENRKIKQQHKAIAKSHRVDEQLINGKPYFGMWFGSYIRLQGDAFVGDLEKNPMMQMAKDHLNGLPPKLLNGEEIRYKELIVRPPYANNPLNCYGSVGVKYVIWGRAFRVMSIIAVRAPKWKKLRRGGKLKWVKLTG